MQAAIGCAQLMKMPSFVEKRREHFERLFQGLKEVEDRLVLPVACEGSNPSWFGFMLTCKDGVDRNKVVSYIESHGIQTRMLFAGNLIKHPCFDAIRNDGVSYRVSGDLKNTDIITERTFWVGVYPGMTEDRLAYMAKVIGEAVKAQ